MVELQCVCVRACVCVWLQHTTLGSTISHVMESLVFNHSMHQSIALLDLSGGKREKKVARETRMR